MEPIVRVAFGRIRRVAVCGESPRNLHGVGDDPGIEAMSGPVDDDRSEDALDVAAHASGDERAFGRLYDRHAAVVLSLCRTLIPGHALADAEDAAQESFLRAHRLIDRLVEPAGFRPWLLQIARLVCAERRRSAARRHRHEEEAMTIARERAEQPPHGAHAVGRREELARLSAALAGLPEAERLAIHLYYLDPDPVRAAESALGLSRSGFYKVLARGRERLAALLREEASR